MEQIFWYCLGLAAREHGVTVHAAVLMSTHLHITVTDDSGTKPAFRRRFHRLLALCTKAFRGWPEEVFNKSPGGEHELLTARSVVRNLAYLIANPALSGAVRYAKDWPGAKTLAGDIGTRVIRVERPDFYLDARNLQWPDHVEIPLTMPQILIDEYGSIAAAQKVIAAEVKRLERTSLRKSKELRRPFAGARRVLRTKHTARSSSVEPFGALNPQFAVAGDMRAAQEAVQRIRAFNAAYDAALSLWKKGERDAIFPHGTWWMRVHHGARCHPPP